MSALFKPIIATMMLAAAGSIAAMTVAADAPATANTSKLTTGLTPLEQLLELMDTDQSRKVSKDEFMRFVSAEFDFADKNEDAEPDPVEL
jgi:hypothetical protein